MGYWRDRFVRHETQLRSDDRMRHVANGGSGFPYAEFLPKEGKARGVQIDLQPDMLSLRYPMDVNLVGDSKETLRLLLPMLEPKQDNAWRETVSGWTEAWWKTLEDRAMTEAKPINPQRVAWELSPRLPAMRSSPVIQGLAPTGTRATSKSAAA
jgi:thiamine pyrophosphate-dependent acetolactate synthase large subunit-like protein